MTNAKVPEFQPLDAEGHALCMCGCGQRVPLAPYNHATKGYVKGEPLKYIHGHSSWVVKNQLEPPNPDGYCFCGCGQRTPICKNTNQQRGNIQGEHTRYVYGHSSRCRPKGPVADKAA